MTIPCPVCGLTTSAVVLRLPSARVERCQRWGLGRTVPLRLADNLLLVARRPA